MLTSSFTLSSAAAFQSLDNGQAAAKQAELVAVGSPAETQTAAEIEVTILKDALVSASAERDAAVASLSKLQAERQQDGAENEMSEEKLKDILGEMDALQKTNERLEEELRSAVRNKGVNFELFEAVQGQLDNALAKNSDHQVALSHLQGKLQQAHAQERAAEAEIARLREQLGDNLASPRSSEAAALEVGRLRDEIEHLKATLKLQEHNSDSLFELHSTHQDEKGEQQAIIADLQAQLMMAQQDMLQRQREDSISGSRGSGLHQALADLESCNKSLTVDLEAALDGQAAAEERAERVQLECSGLQQEMEALKGLHKALREELEELAQHSSLAVQQSREAEDSKRDVLERMEAIANECEALKKELSSSAGSSPATAEAQEAAAERAAAGAEARRNLNTSPDWRQARAQMESVIQGLAEELDDARGRLHKASGEVQLLREELQAAEAELAAKKAAFDGLEREYDAVLAELTAVETAAGEHQQAAEAEARARVQEKEVQCNSLEAEIQDAKAQVLGLREEVAGQEQQEARLKLECQRLKQELQIVEDSSHHFARLSEEHGQLKSRLEKATAAAAQSQSQEAAAVEKLTSELAAVSAENDSLRTAIGQKDGGDSGTMKPLAPIESSMVFELWRIVEENEMLREETERYKQDVEKLIQTGQLGHTNAKQKLQYHLSWKKDLEALKQECTVLLRERFQLEQCVRYLAVRCGLAVTSTDVTATQWRDAVAKIQPASLAASSVRLLAGNNKGTMPDLKLLPPKSSQEEAGDGSSGAEVSAPSGSYASVESTVEQHILQRIAYVCLPAGAKHEGELKTSGPNSLIVTTVRPKLKNPETESERDSSEGGSTSKRGVSRVANWRAKKAQ